VPLVDPALAALCEGPGGPALVGLRHPVTDEADPDWLSRAEVRHGLRAAADTGLVHDLLVRPDQLPAAVRAVRELPEVRFVLDHAGNPVIDPDAFTRWAGHMAALAACPNVAVKLVDLLRTGDLVNPGPGPGHRGVREQHGHVRQSYRTHVDRRHPYDPVLGAGGRHLLG
jgi:L-fuconolactonase